MHILHKLQAHLKYFEKCPHVEVADTKRDFKYSWYHYKDKQKSHPHSHADAKTPAE